MANLHGSSIETTSSTEKIGYELSRNCSLASARIREVDRLRDDSTGEDEPPSPGSKTPSEPDHRSLSPEQTKPMEPGILEYFSAKKNIKREKFRVSEIMKF